MQESSRTLEKALKPREAAVFAGLADAYCAPVAPFTAVRDSDAVAFVRELVAASPRVNRIGFRIILRVVDVAPLLRGYRRRFRALERAERDDFLDGLDNSRWFMLRVAGRLLKTVTLMSYYGDAGVLGQLGYDPEANLARARALREKEGRS